MTKVPALALAAAVLAAGLTGCGQKRWCEHDATDTKVSDRYCKNHVPGYEWEHGDYKKKKKKKH
ncbi:hypothetical protein [Actinomadura parmotrematis]|uniref:Lipoprotein n=1 Tax=Actinomadura parmotrematis TaxID=2864039 RepID=A0ABS7FSD0_9ACTN|nr:hypothetical protein [Actinomadura parmotrematis]MBW8482865.1 hypothetical protein [Actinomadura parmotrematis]